MIRLSLQAITKKYQSAAQPAVEDISFELEEGNILALVGPSGCGKTTTLRLIAGLERPESGQIYLNNNLVASEDTFIPPENRGVGMVFQDHALFPHLTVAGNIEFGLRRKKTAERNDIVAEMLRMVGLASYARRYPHELSGGERQRVALARALAPSPVLLLMDEPFSSLDTDLRLEMREEVRSLLKKLRATVIFVTHDQEEALFMGDQLAVFQKGRIDQVGTPQEIFQSSSTRFVAEFMGNSQFLPGIVSVDGIHTEVGLVCQPANAPLHTMVDLAVRADDVNFHPDPYGNSVVVKSIFRGITNLYQLRLDSGLVLHSMQDHTLNLPVGERVRAFVSAEHPLCIFPSQKNKKKIIDQMV